MNGSPLARLSRLISIVFMMATAAVLAAGNAAASSFKLTPTESKESNGEWTVNVRIELNRAPALHDVPLKFTFGKTVVFERTLTDKGPEPVNNRMPLRPAPKHVDSWPVHFVDASGNTVRITNFHFTLQREAGFFEAGEYEVTINGPDGDVGSAQKLVLKGDNPIVDRRSMDFGPKKDDKKEGAAAAKPADDEPVSKGATPDEVKPVGKAPPMVGPGDDTSVDDEIIHKRPGSGCGCAVVGDAGIDAWRGAGLLAFGIGIVALRSRRRRAGPAAPLSQTQK